MGQALPVLPIVQYISVMMKTTRTILQDQLRRNIYGTILKGTETKAG